MIRFESGHGIVYINRAAIIGVRVVESPIPVIAEKGGKQVIVDCVGTTKYYSESNLTEEYANMLCNDLLLDLGWQIEKYEATIKGE